MATSSRPAWRTSTFTDNGQSCVEVAPGPGAVRVRDTKDHGRGPELVLHPDTFAALCALAASGAATTGHPAPGDLTITRDERVTRHDGRPVTTHWHVTAAGAGLHYTDAEWSAFAAGVRAGEFAFAPA